MSRRSVLLPPYLASNPAWQQLVESIDEVFEGEIDEPIKFLAKLRDNWILLDSASADVDERNVLNSETNFYAVDRETLIRQANMLGFLFKESDLLSDADYRRIVRNLGMYWYSKGKPNFVDFLSFCMDATLQIVKMWSTQGSTYDTYGPMLPEGDAGIGTPNHEGGDWFETSHVQLIIDPANFPTQSVSKLIALFNTLANYDLVLDSMVFESPDISVVTSIPVKAYPMVDISEIIYTVALKAPTADFNFSLGTSGEPIALLFDMSTQAPTSWLWEFSDTQPDSTLQNPVVTFDNFGGVSVTLTVTNNYGSNSITKVINIKSLSEILLENGSGSLLLENGDYLLLD